VEDLYCLGTLSTTMQEGQTLTVTATIAAIGAAPGAGRTVVTRRTAPPLRRVYLAASLTIEPPRAIEGQVQADADSRFLEQLRRAANDFIVVRNFSDRHGSGASTGRTVIAGYHWFGDWGRDTMIALPGLTQLTGRVAEACEVLGAWARVVNRGMLPNRFPDSGAQLAKMTSDERSGGGCRGGGDTKGGGGGSGDF
jgi:glycogen debranching enzyme